MRKAVMFCILVSVVSLTGCMRPYQAEPIVQIQPHETAFYTQLEGAGEQGKADSQSKQEQKQIYNRRVTIPLAYRQVGIWDNVGFWIPAGQVIVVDRSPVAREWTKDTKTGTEGKDQAISVESLEGIGFEVGVSIQARVVEADAATFLYNYPAKEALETFEPVNSPDGTEYVLKLGTKLAPVVDTNVRQTVGMILAREFSKHTLADVQRIKPEIFKICFDETREHYKVYGIDIVSLGSSEGLWYENKVIQESIDRKFTAENERAIAAQEQEAQRIRNKTLVEKQEAEAQAAAAIEKASEGYLARRRLELQEKWYTILEKFADKWNGSVPTNWAVIPSNLLDMFGK